ncbi:MAG TPA: hypothetical protein VKA57_01070, partial [Solirubrobacteraceae bacterium]|nr:hypothetical protein [Solirubrobacteraceae bacterium]
MPDHVAREDAEAALEPARQPQRRAALGPAPHHVGVRDADVLDPDRAVVEPDGVAAAPAQRDELVDRAVVVDEEVRADSGPLAELDVGRVGGERLERRFEAARAGVVLDDHLRLDELRLRLAVVAQRVAPHLALAVR